MVVYLKFFMFFAELGVPVASLRFGMFLGIMMSFEDGRVKFILFMCPIFVDWGT
jgi:hypothetical protein